MPEEASDWALVGLDSKIAKKRGMPARIPVPTGELQAIGDKGMSVDVIRGWLTRFMSTCAPAWRAENAALVKSFEAFLGKKDAWAKAQAAFARRDFDTAVASLRLIAAIDPDDHAARLNLASALASQGDNKGAMAHLDAIEKTWDDDPEFHVTRANVLLSLDRRDDAIGACADALERDPSYRPALDVLTRLGVLVSVYEDPRNAASLTYVRADSVSTHLEGLWSATPRDVTYYLDQASYHELERRFDVALAAAQRAVDLGGASPHPRAVSYAIDSLRALGRLEEATRLAREQIARTGSAQGHVDLARCLLAANDEPAAITELDRAIQLDPGHLVALDLRWWPADRHDLPQLQTALLALRAHAERHPGDPGAARMLGRVQLALGNTEEGLVQLQSASAAAPEDDDARAEWWNESLRHGASESVMKDAAGLADMARRDWKLRWTEAEAFAQAGRAMEAQAAYAAINRDETLPLDVRKRAKRAATAAKKEP